MNKDFLCLLTMINSKFVGGSQWCFVSLRISISSEPVSSKLQKICVFPCLQCTITLVNGHISFGGRFGGTFTMCTGGSGVRSFQKGTQTLLQSRGSESVNYLGLKTKQEAVIIHCGDSRQVLVTWFRTFPVINIKQYSISIMQPIYFVPRPSVWTKAVWLSIHNCCP